MLYGKDISVKNYFLLFTVVLIASSDAFSFFFFPGKCNVFNLPFYCLLSFAGPFFISSQVIFLIAVLCDQIKLAIISKLCHFTACLVFHLLIYCETITLTTLTSAGQMTWQSRSSPEESWKALSAADTGAGGPHKSFKCTAQPPSNELGRPFWWYKGWEQSCF